MYDNKVNRGLIRARIRSHRIGREATELPRPVTPERVTWSFAWTGRLAA